MLRVVFAVVLAVAILAVASPAVEQARHERAAGTVRADLADLEATAATLRDREETVPADLHGARRTVTVRVPEGSATMAGVDYVEVGGRPNAKTPRTSVAYRLDGRRERRRATDLPLRTPDGDPLVLDRPGRHRLVLELVRRDGRPTVRVSRAGVYAGSGGDDGP